MGWNPQQYLKFEQPRLRPALDLLARVDTAAPQRVYDLGCGTGNITRLLAERWPTAQVTGVDDSAAMLAKARETRADIEWVEASLATWQPPAPADVIYSNAALHWLPDHETLFPAVAQSLVSGGVLAVQMPRNFLAPSHTLIFETASDGPWRSKLEHLSPRTLVSEPRFYYEALAPFAATLDIWETEYSHVLDGKDAVKEWTKGTFLKRYLDALDEPMRSEFEAEYARRTNIAYPPLPSGQTLFPFRRLFIVMKRK